MVVKEAPILAVFQGRICSDRAAIFFFLTEDMYSGNLYSTFGRLSIENTNVDFYGINVDKSPGKDIYEYVKITSTPAFITYKNGSKVEELVGDESSELDDKLKAMVTKVAA